MTATVTAIGNAVPHEQLLRRVERLYLRKSDRHACNQIVRLATPLFELAEKMLLNYAHRADKKDFDPLMFARDAHTLSSILNWLSQSKQAELGESAFQLSMRLCVGALELEEDSRQPNCAIWLYLRILSARLWMQKSPLAPQMKRYVFAELANVASRIVTISGPAQRGDVLKHLANAYAALARMQA